MFEKITKTLSGLAFIKYINSLIDYVNTSDIDATRIKGQLDISNIPPAGLDNVIKVDTVTDMLALTVDDVQNGDTVMIIGVTPPVQYQVVDDTKLGTMDAFQEYAAGTATKALADINGNNIHTTYGKLAGNNTWTGNNYWNGSTIFNANLTIRGSATTPGDVSTYLWLGTQPEGSEQTPSIARNKTGELIMYAADYRHCYLRSGIQTSFASVYNSDGTVEFSSLNNTPWGKYTNANGLELTVNKTPTVNTDVSNKKYVDDSVASAGGGSNLTTYTSLEQLGITPGQETFASIHSALPRNSVLEYYASEAQNFADIYPASYGNFRATRLTGDITIFHFTGTNQIIYVTHYHVTNNTNPSWTQIAKQSDLTDLSNSVVKSVNGVIPTGGNVDINRKFYNNLTSLGLSYATVTFADIINTLPVNSTLTFYVDVVTSEPSYAPNLQIPASGLVIVVKGVSNTVPTLFYLTPIVKGYTSYTGQYTTYNDYGFSGWQPVVLSVNGAKPNINGNVTIDIPEPVIASEAEAKAGTNNTKFMTPLRVKQAISALAGDSSWTISKGTNGWARENSTGLTVQWGYVNRSNSGTFTFPRTFTTCYYSNVMCSSNLVPYITARSNTSITFNTNNGYNDDIQNWGNCYIFAIGVS